MNPERVIEAHLALCRAQAEAAEAWRPVARESAKKRAKLYEDEIAEARLAQWRAEGLAK